MPRASKSDSTSLRNGMLTASPATTPRRNFTKSATLAVLGHRRRSAQLGPVVFGRNPAQITGSQKRIRVFSGA